MSRTALVTGAGGGIGLATATRLAADGMAVLATDVKGRPEGLPATVNYVSFDLLDKDPADLLDALDSPALDYLVNAAGLALFDRDGSVLDTGEAVWEATLG